MGYTIPEHGWSDMSTPPDAVGADRFYRDVAQGRVDVVYPSSTEMQTYLRLLETGQATNVLKATPRQIAKFRKLYDEQFTWIKDAKWVCPNNTTTVNIPRDALYFGREQGIGKGMVLTRLRPADLLGLHLYLASRKSGYDFSPLAELIASPTLPAEWEVQEIRKIEKGEKSYKRPLVCGTCGVSHPGSSFYFRPTDMLNGDYELSPASISIAMGAREPYGKNMRLLDTHQVPLQSLRNAISNKVSDANGWGSFEQSIFGVNKQTIAAFKSLKRSKIDKEIAGEWAIAISAFEFTWNDENRFAVEDLISRGFTTADLNAIWVEMPVEDRMKNKPDLYIALKRIQFDIDVSLISSMGAAV